MGGMGQTTSSLRSGGTTTPTTTTTAPSKVGLSTEYEANRPQIMPVYNSPTQIESARKRRQEIMARSGRGSTNLRGNPGTMTYQNSFLGNVA